MDFGDFPWMNRGHGIHQGDLSAAELWLRRAEAAGLEDLAADAVPLASRGGSSEIATVQLISWLVVVWLP